VGCERPPLRRPSSRPSTALRAVVLSTPGSPPPPSISPPPFFSFSVSNGWWQRIWRKRILRAAAAQGIGADGARVVLKGGGTLDTRVILPQGHPWCPSHGGDVAAILWPAPRVRGRDCRAKGSNPPLEEHPRLGLGRPRSLASCQRGTGRPIASRTPRACVGARYGRKRKKGQRGGCRLGPTWR
jgi:hypothetical protein